MTCDNRLSIVFTTLLFTLFFSVYWYSASPYFLFDDYAALSQNPLLINFDPKRIADWKSLAESSNAGPLGRPVSMISFGLDVLLAGRPDAGLMKITNITLHAICAVIVGVFVSKLWLSVVKYPSGKVSVWAGFLAALLWFIAPLHVSTVLYPVQRMAQLSTLFVLLGLAVFMHARAKWSLEGAKWTDVICTTLWLLLILLLAIGSKENGVLLIWLLGLTEVTIFRGSWSGERNSSVLGVGWFIFLAPVFVIASVCIFYPEWVLAGYESREFNLWERLLTEARMLWFYFGLLLLPSINRFAFSHDYIEISSSITEPISTLGALCALGIVLALAYQIRSRAPWVLYGIGFFLIGHSIESSFLALELVFEHRNYLPSVGIIIIITFAVFEVGKQVGRAAMMLTIAALVCGAGTMLLLRANAWSDPLVMAWTEVQHHPDSPRAHYLLARSYEAKFEAMPSDEKDADIDSILRARDHYEQMLLLAPRALAPPVLLFFIDTQYFPDNPDIDDWLELISEGAAKKIQSASDINALVSFFRCAAGGCEINRNIGNRILSNWRRSSSDSLHSILAAYNWGMATEQENLTSSALLQLSGRYNKRLESHYVLLERSVINQDAAGMYENLFKIYRDDRNFSNLKNLQRLIDE